MTKWSVRPFTAIHVLISLLALLLTACLVVVALDVPKTVRVGDYRQLIIFLGDAFIIFLMLRFVFGTSINLYSDRLVVATVDMKSLWPKTHSTTILFRDITGYGVVIRKDLRDIFVVKLTNGSGGTFDFETYSDAQSARLLMELYRRTQIWPTGEIAPERLSSPNAHPVLTAIAGFTGFVVLFLILPVGSIWAEGWINPAHPPNYQSGWRTGYMLAAMFAGIALASVIIMMRLSATRQDATRESDDNPYHRLRMAFAWAAIVLYGIFVVLFAVSVGR